MGIIEAVPVKETTENEVIHEEVVEPIELANSIENNVIEDNVIIPVVEEAAQLEEYVKTKEEVAPSTEDNVEELIVKEPVAEIKEEPIPVKEVTTVEAKVDGVIAQEVASPVQQVDDSEKVIEDIVQ